MIVMDWIKECPSFLREQAYCAGLSEKRRFERVKSFCYAARSKSVEFLAIVESDGFVGALTPLEMCKRKQKKACRRKSTTIGGQDKLQSSQGAVCLSYL